ncbi:hypothetical protein [Ferruginibacter sp. SUN106]|uniref:hypothetical protein n=1 Tax=Ferruginibacter sp. SUN106 TaxID=2978348 RepID=UPI003D36BD8F
MPVIEQTALIVTKWLYHPPVNLPEIDETKLSGLISLDVQKKRALEKKGIACRFTCNFAYANEPLLDYVAEDSYVIDLPDVIDKNELHSMIRNSYAKFKEKFDFRKMSTVLSNIPLQHFDESKYDLEPVLLLLQ